MHMNTFNHDAFSTVMMTEVMEDYDFKPDLVGSLGLFEEVPISTTSVSVERRGNNLSIIKASPRGAPLDEGGRDERKIYLFDTVRIAKGDTIHAAEIQNMRAFGRESELETAIGFISRRQDRLIREIELTWENMMLGAVQGAVLDADGSVIVDWFAEWEITPPANINFKLNVEDTNIEGICRGIIRDMQVKSKGAFRAGSHVIALCGDEFFDGLTHHKSVRETYLNTINAQNLNQAFGVATQSALQTGSFANFAYGGITFINYRGVDNYDEKAAKGTQRAIGIKPKEAQFLPVNTEGVFQKAFAPLESFDFANTLGRPLYSMLIRDEERNFWIRPEVYSYPLFICTRPELLMKGIAQ